MNLLSIGGSDPSAGAGIQSDIKTFQSLNAYGLTVITAITSQNTSDFGLIEPVSPKIFENQMETIFSDFKVDGIKIGMVYNSNIIKIINRKCKNLTVPIVLDPIIKSTTGGLLLERSAVNDFKKFLIPLANAITPNKFEAEVLSKTKINSIESAKKAAKKIQKMGASNIAITGFETKNNQISDFILEQKNEYVISGEKYSKINHGSGCTYSSSLLFALAKRKSFRESTKFSKEFTEKSIQNANKIGKGIVITQSKPKDQKYLELIQAINKFIEIKDSYKLVPECQTNFVFSKNSPNSINDILGISGRIVKTGNNVTLAGDLEYGGSKHVAVSLIAMAKKYPEVHSAINLKYNKKSILKFKKSGMIISSYNRKDEPKIIKNKEGESIKWGIKSALKKSESQPDVIYHTGDFGKEPMIIVFGKTPLSIIEKISWLCK